MGMERMTYPNGSRMYVPTRTMLKENIFGVLLALMILMAMALAGIAQGSITKNSTNHRVLRFVFSMIYEEGIAMPKHTMAAKSDIVALFKKGAKVLDLVKMAT